MKKISIYLILIIFLALTGCAEKQQILNVGIKPDFPPFEYKEADVLTGFDVDLMREIGKRTGYKIRFVEMEFDQLLPSVNDGKIDLAISAITINQQREELVDFSVPYFNADQVIIKKQEREITIGNDADLSNYKIATQNGTTGQYYLQYNLVENGELPWDHLVAFETNNQALSAMLNDKVDLVIMDDSAAQAFCNIKPVSICYHIITNEEYGIAMKKGCQLKDKINTSLTDLMNSSYWTEMITDYMGE